MIAVAKKWYSLLTPIQVGRAHGTPSTQELVRAAPQPSTTTVRPNGLGHRVIVPVTPVTVQQVMSVPYRYLLIRRILTVAIMPKRTIHNTPVRVPRVVTKTRKTTA